jgi:anaerobic nitric oxide reductase flavorubredoxin
MDVTQVSDNIFRLSANVGEEILFEGMWPLPHGLSMNSYIVKGEECAIIDGVCGWDGVPDTLFAQLRELSIEPDQIRHVILNHLEPDHTAWLVPFRKVAGEFRLYASRKGLELAEAFYGIRGNGQPVKSGDTLDLGRGVNLQFEEVPNVHWPETIATYERSSGTLFPCDAFSSFGKIEAHPYDDQLDEKALKLFEDETLRYFANILASFTSSVDRAIRKLEGLDLRIVAPAHGVVWRKDPRRIVELYKKYCRYGKGEAEPQVTVIWGSMYGMTGRALEAVLEGVRSEGVQAEVFRVPESHISHILASAWKSAGIIVGAPTYEYKMFPPVAAVLDELGRKRVMNKKAFRFGSFGWSGGAQRELEAIMERLRMRWEFLDPVEFKGAPGREDLALLRRRGRELAAAVKSLTGSAFAEQAAS